MNRLLSPSVRRMLAWIACLALGPILTAPGALPAEIRPELRQEIKVYSGLVMLGDLFDNAGPAAGAPVFRSPDLGTQGIVNAKRVAAAARQHGVYWTNPRNISQITVYRPCRHVTVEEIIKAIAGRAARVAGLASTSDLKVIFDSRSKAYHVDPRITGSLVVKQFTASERSGRFHAVVSFDDPDHRTVNHSYRGRVYETETVAVLARPIDRGAMIRPDDVKTLRMPKTQIKAGVVMETEQLAGMAAKRKLAAGQPVRRTDLERPKLVRRNALVTVSYEIPGLKLKSQGRAQADAALGETIQVLNPRSNRTIEAVVRGPGLVTVTGSLSRKISPPVLAENRTGAPGAYSVR